MNQISTIAAGTRHQVTSSELVRHFGEWQERAGRAPVYVIHRGRPRLVLVSVEIMDALCSPHAAEGDRAVTAHALADTLPEPLLVLDDRGRVAHANAAATTRFGAAVRPGAVPAELSTTSGDFLGDAVARVLASGVEEAVEIVPDRFPARRLSCHVAPLPTGAALRLEESSARDEAAAARAAADALRAAVGASELAALARVNPRGYLVGADASLARMTGAAAEQLATARFATLFDVADRARLGEAIEGAFAGIASRVADARLLVRGAQPAGVAVALAPMRVGGRVEEVSALLVRTA